MQNKPETEAKDRILATSIKLFSQKGFDGTSVNLIAQEAKVNKALIYYYFKSKEEILDRMIQSLFDGMTELTLSFVHETMVEMISLKQLDILSDRLRFADKKSLDTFIAKLDAYYHSLLDYAIDNKAVLRILMLESLKNDSKYSNGLFRFLEMTKADESNPVYKTIWEADQDFTYTSEMTLYRFFFNIIPIVNFAAYFDDYKTISKIEGTLLIDSFMRSCHTTTMAFVSGTDLHLHTIDN
ncbi:transcriptional regulator [Sphaerochaeta pleomorpha str. Grapes]|uniref:Transcriptional regulator n=1 Tax=Sphaerochaeta pleomorpha (strain ATCC BAA-1885 / DSM 22778 / Grapes) TaxID=158190 RepID=G8QQU0_SPHPG|nr:TetR/AcrR family transcriptional regulator [Sphaerochaeta pleomorpha]AEV28721.1 transcriptional regulator [Sphaerochaeta pleomorpha str. Grapes]